MSDIFQEVEEDIRRERYEKLWKQYGSYVVGGVVLLLLGMLGWQQWQAYQGRLREKHAAMYYAAETLLEDGNDAAAAKAFADLADAAGPGYRAVARLREAEALLQQGQPDKALAAYDALVADSSANRMMRNLAALKGALLVADSVPPAVLRKRLAEALRPDSPWRYAAQELVSYALYRAGELENARNEYQSLVNEFAAPSHIRARAREMVALIDSERPIETDESAAGAGPATERQPTEGRTGKGGRAGDTGDSGSDSVTTEDDPTDDNPVADEDQIEQPSGAGDGKPSGGPSGN